MEAGRNRNSFLLVLQLQGGPILAERLQKLPTQMRKLKLVAMEELRQVVCTGPRPACICSFWNLEYSAKAQLSAQLTVGKTLILGAASSPNPTGTWEQGRFSGRTAVCLGLWQQTASTSRMLGTAPLWLYLMPVSSRPVVKAVWNIHWSSPWWQRRLRPWFSALGGPASNRQGRWCWQGAPRILSWDLTFWLGPAQ